MDASGRPLLASWLVVTCFLSLAFLVRLVALKEKLVVVFLQSDVRT